MGNWLRENAFIAGWLSPLIALLGIIIKGFGSGVAIDWTRSMLYIGFLTCLAATFTPAIDPEARIFAGSCAVGLGIFFMNQVDQSK